MIAQRHEVIATSKRSARCSCGWTPSAKVAATQRRRAVGIHARSAK